MNSIPGRIQDGKPVINKLSWQCFTEVNEGRWFDIVARKPKRSLQQNRYLWVIYTYIAEETGHTPDEIHEIEKQRHLPKTTKTFAGDDFTISPSTTSLTVGEFRDYIEKVIADAAHLGIVIPTPEEAGYISNHGSMAS